MQHTHATVSLRELVRRDFVPRLRRGAAAAALALALAPAAGAQAVSGDDVGGGSGSASEPRGPRTPRRKAAPKRDARANPVSVRDRADRDRGYRIVVSLADRHLWVISQQDTLLSAPVAVGSGATLTGLGRTWQFHTPTGVRRVIGKRTNPVWTPPDWMYVETAKENGLEVRQLSARRPYTLADGRKLVVRGDRVGIVSPGSTAFVPVRLDEHIIYDETIFIPPMGTRNRRVERELGRFALDTGDGYLLHGTPYESSIGQRVSHGCVRLRDEDVAWLHRYVPVGTRVYLY